MSRVDPNDDPTASQWITNRIAEPTVGQAPPPTTGMIGTGPQSDRG